jgi:hypothetical protein
MEHREPSVRELFRTASALARSFVVRQPAQRAIIHGGAAAGLTRQGSGSGHGGTQSRHSHDGLRRAPSRSAHRGSDAGSRPASPDDVV